VAQIDLKFATVKFIDGYALTGAINNAGGALAGALTITCLGFTGKVGNGDTFTISGETGSPVHTVTSHIETAGNTTSITFTTAIAAGGVVAGAAINVTKAGAVNNVAGYTAGTTTMLVNGFTGAVSNGDTFTVAGETGSPVHTVTGHTETGGNTTSVTFSVVLATGGAANAAVITVTRASQAGVVNSAGANAGDTTLPVDLIVGAVAVGDQFVVAGETLTTTVHTVTAHAETTGNTTSMTFTPALGPGTYADDAVVTFQPHTLEAVLGDGNLEYTEKRNIEYKLNKGRIKFVRLGDEVPLDASLDFVWEFLTGATGDLIPTIEDALKQRNLASNWVTTGLDPCEPYCLDIQVVYTPPCTGVKSETILLRFFRYEELQHNFKDAKVSVKGKCNALAATVSRAA
jgi:hypothetical protein